MASTKKELTPQQQELQTLIGTGGVIEAERHIPQDDGSERVERRIYRKGDKVPADVTDYVTIRDSRGLLTHEGMEYLAKQGEGIVYNGEVLTDPETYPDEITLAADDAARRAELVRQIDEEQAVLERKKALLQQTGQEATQSRPEAAGQSKEKEEQQRQEERQRQEEQCRQQEAQRQQAGQHGQQKQEPPKGKKDG